MQSYRITGLGILTIFIFQDFCLKQRIAFRAVNIKQLRQYSWKFTVEKHPNRVLG